MTRYDHLSRNTLYRVTGGLIRNTEVSKNQKYLASVLIG